MAKQRDIMVWYGERSQWVLNPRICPLGIGRMYFLMCQILSVLSCVLLLMKHHERFFGFSRRSSSGASIPTWLSTPGSVYLKRQVRTSKMEPLVNEVGLLQANTRYAHVRYPDGWETTAATKHLAPKGWTGKIHPQPSPEHAPKSAENMPFDETNT